MSRSLKRQIEKLKAIAPLPSVPLSELPVEAWTASELEDAIPKTTLQNFTDEEHFYKWLEELPKRLLFGVKQRFMKATGQEWTFDGPAQPLPEELDERVVNALPLHVEHWRQLWVENAGAREERRRWVAEIERRYPKGPRTPENGYGWWFTARKNCKRLAEKYCNFESAWRAFYERWKDETTPGTPMADELRDEFMRICFVGSDPPR